MRKSSVRIGGFGRKLRFCPKSIKLPLVVVVTPLEGNIYVIAMCMYAFVCILAEKGLVFQSITKWVNYWKNGIFTVEKSYKFRNKVG